MSKSVARSLFRILYFGGFAAAIYAGWDALGRISKSFDEIPIYGGVARFLAVIAAGMAVFYIEHTLAALFGAFYVRVSAESNVNLEAGGNRTRNLQRQAAKLIRRGEFSGAGEVFESMDDWSGASLAYEQGGLLDRAAAAAAKAGQAERAIALFESAGSYEEAATLALKEGLREKAIKFNRMAADKAIDENRFARGAELYEAAGDYAKAGRTFENSQKVEEALRCYDKGNEAESLVRLFQAQDPATLARRGADTVELIKRCAETLAREGLAKEAGLALRAVEDHLRSGEVFEAAGFHDEAGESFLQANQLERAEKAYAGIEDPVRVAEFGARVALLRGDWATAGARFAEAGKLNQAVDAFKRGKEYVSAAKVYESMKRYLMAAEMYSSAKDFLAAGRAFAQAPDWRNAAECFEEAGELPQALEAYVNAGLYLKAGTLAIRLEDIPKAIEYLQRVPNTSPDHRMATAHLAMAFHENGRRDMARDLFRRMQDNVAVSRETLPIYYSFARLLEDDRNPEAILMYHQILGIQVDFKDVQERANRMEAESTASAATRATWRESNPGSGYQESDGLTSHGFTSNPGLTQDLTVHQMATNMSMSGMPTVVTSMATEAATQFATQARGAVPSTPPVNAGPWRPATQAAETRFGEEGRYKIIEELGRGGMAIVYKAEDQHLRREVALKTFPLSRHSGPGREDVFLNEARMVARLSHPNIVTIFDSGHMNFLYYIAMEYIDGENLKSRVKRKGPMSLDEARSAIGQLASALHYAHGQQVLHLDVKPGNAIMRDGGHVKVVDFGLARILSNASTSMPAEEDSQRTLVGTPQYMAPEQILAQQVDARSDIYSLGLTLFVTLTGRTPFEIKRITDPLEISRQQVHSSFPKPSTLNATLPNLIDDIFVRCTQKNPEERYQTVRDFLDDFDRL